jgi:prepilin-type processing-associated H-X9-DG protein
MYADVQGDRFPGQPDDGRAAVAAGGDGRNYYDILRQFSAEPAIWLCPSTWDEPGRLMSYHMNGLIITPTGLRRAKIKESSRTLLIGESGQHTRFDEAYLRPDHEGNYLYDRPQHNHHQGSNATFVDGHVAWYDDSQWTETSFRVAP